MLIEAILAALDLESVLPSSCTLLTETVLGSDSTLDCTRTCTSAIANDASPSVCKLNRRESLVPPRRSSLRRRWSASL
jgi:hypothetical protein